MSLNIKGILDVSLLGSSSEIRGSSTAVRVPQSVSVVRGAVDACRRIVVITKWCAK